MPILLKACSVHWCRNVHTNKRYCDEHMHLEREEKRRIYKQYNESRKDSKEDKFYKSREWQRARAVRLDIDNYLCQSCKRSVANTVHHIVEVKQDYDKRLDIDNLISLCTSCHNKIHHKS